MAYPFTQALPWKEFLAQLKTLNVQLKHETIRGLQGKIIPVTYLEHKMDGKTFYCELEISALEKCVLPSMVRYICARLKIHPRVFGLDLG